MKPTRIVLGASLLLLLGAPAAAQGIDFRGWLSGERGLFAPDYITPSEHNPGYMIGGPQRVPGARGGRLMFAAASVDARCQQNGSPSVQVLMPPRNGRIAVDIGGFLATGIDGGSTYCLGRSVRGTRVFYLGRAPRRGDRFSIRVTFPTRGLTYDHEVVVPGR